MVRPRKRPNNWHRSLPPPVRALLCPSPTMGTQVYEGGTGFPGKGSCESAFWHLAMAESRPRACTYHGCLRHGTTVLTSLDGRTLTRRLRAPIQTRCKTRKASKHSRYMRVKRLVNFLRSTRRAGKVEHMSGALALVALTHLSYMHNELPFMLELASSPLVKLPCSPPRTIPAFGRLARKGGCTSSAAGGTVGSSSARCIPSTGCVL